MSGLQQYGNVDQRICVDYSYFVQQLEVFEYPAGGRDILTQLLQTNQGNQSAAEYAVSFRILAAQSGWNDLALLAIYKRSLNVELQAELACKGENMSLNDYITLVYSH